MSTPFERPRPLRDPTIPEPDESLRGLFARAIAKHHLPNAWSILRFVGGQHRNRINLSEDERLDMPELARILGTPLAEIEARRYPRTNARNRSFFGLDLCEQRIENRLRRFSPNALSSAPYARAVWELRDLPFCSFGWDLLRDGCSNCPTGTRQGWTRPNGVDRCDVCGRPLSEMTTALVPEEFHAGLRLVSDLADPVASVRRAALGKLHPAIGSEENRSALFVTIMRIRNLISTALDPVCDVEALHAACRALLRWPEGIEDLTPAPGVSWTRWSAAADAYMALGRRPENAASDGNSDERDWKTSLACVTSPRIAAELRRRGDLIGIRTAYELGRTSAETLRYGMDSGHLPFVMVRRGRKDVPMMVPDDVTAFANEWHRRQAPGTVGYRLGLGPAGVEAIAAPDLLPDRGLRLPGEPSHFLEDDVDLFVARIKDAASETANECDLPLLTAVMIVHGRLKPWASIVRALLNGTLPFRLVEGDQPVIRRSMVDRERLYAISRMYDREPSADRPLPSVLQKLEAMHTLNSSNGDALTGLVPVGTNPRLYATADVLTLGAAGITAGEWALRRRMDPRVAWQQLRRANVPEVAKGLFDRIRAETISRTKE